MELLLIIPLLILSAFYSGSETALYSMSPVRLEYLNSKKIRRARIIKWLHHPIGPTIITILIANNVVAELLARITEQSLSGLGSYSVLVTTVVVTPLVIIFGEFLPKWIARQKADQLVYQIAFVLGASRLILSLPVMVLRIITQFIHLLIPGEHQTVWAPHTSRPNLRTFIRSPENSQVIAPVQQRLIDRILALERINLAYDRVAKPLDTVEILPQNTQVKDILPKLGPKYYQRYLIGNPHTRQAIGWISAQDLLVSDEHSQLKDIAKDLPRLPAETPLHNALQRMHQDGAEMVLVLDRQGRPQKVAFRGDCLKILMDIENT